MPARKKIEKVETLVAKLCSKTEYVMHTRNLNQASNQRLILKKVHRVINFNEKVWLKPYIEYCSKKFKWLQKRLT